MPDSCMVYIWWNHRRLADSQNFEFDPTGNTQGIFSTQSGARVNNAARNNARAAQFFGIGHAGLNFVINNNERYITWFGNVGNKQGSSAGGSSNGSSARSPFVKLRAGAHHLHHRGDGDRVTLQRDAEGYSGGLNSARKINFNLMKMDQLGHQRIFTDKVRSPFGIDLSEVDRFWDEILRMPPESADIYYSAASLEHNCCGMVARALTAGRLHWYAPPPNNQIYQGVRSLYNWCKEGQQAIIIFNQAWNKIIDKHFITYLHGGIDVPVGWDDILRQSTATIPTLEEWRRSSNIGWYAKRIEQIAILDSLIQRYHGLPNGENRLRSLMGIMLTAVDHLDRKPRSDRRKAVIDLLGRVIKTIESQVIVQNPFDSQPQGIRLTNGSSHLSMIATDNVSEVYEVIKSRISSNQSIAEVNQQN